MSIHAGVIRLKTKGSGDIVEITGEVASILKKSGLKAGLLAVFVPGATGALTTLEYEPGLVKDFGEMIKKMIPESPEYAHNKSHSDENAHSHLRASLLGPSLTVPFLNSKMTLGIWQQIIFVDFDNRCREREIMVQAVGE